MDIKWESDNQFDAIVKRLIADMPENVCGLNKSDLDFVTEYGIRNPARCVTFVDPLVKDFDGIGHIFTEYISDDTYTFYDRITITHIPTKCAISTNIASLNIAGGIAWTIKKLKKIVDIYYTQHGEDNNKGGEDYAEKNHDETTR